MGPSMYKQSVAISKFLIPLQRFVEIVLSVISRPIWGNSWRHRNKRGSQGFGVMRFCGNFYFKVRYCSVQSPSRVGGNFNFTSRYYWWKKILPRNDLLPFLKYDNSTNPKRWTRTGYLKTESNSRLHQIHFQLDLSACVIYTRTSAS